MDGTNDHLNERDSNYVTPEEHQGYLPVQIPDWEGGSRISRTNPTPIFDVPQVLSLSGGSTRPLPTSPPTLRVDNSEGGSQGWNSPSTSLPTLESFEPLGHQGCPPTGLTVPVPNLSVEGRWPAPWQLSKLPQPESSGFIRNKRKRVDYKSIEGAPRPAAGQENLKCDERLSLYESPKKSKNGGHSASDGGVGKREQDGEGLVLARGRDTEEPVSTQDPETTTEASSGGLQLNMELGYGENVNPDGANWSREELTSESSSSEGYVPNPNPNPNVLGCQHPTGVHPSLRHCFTMNMLYHGLSVHEADTDWEWWEA